MYHNRQIVEVIAFKNNQMRSGWWGFPRETNALLDLRHIIYSWEIFFYFVSLPIPLCIARNCDIFYWSSEDLWRKILLLHIPPPLSKLLVESSELRWQEILPLSGYFARIRSAVWKACTEFGRSVYDKRIL